MQDKGCLHTVHNISHLPNKIESRKSAWISSGHFLDMGVKMIEIKDIGIYS